VAARAEAAAEAAHEAVCAQPRVRTLNTANHNGWQRGERLDGRDAVQQRVAGADKADEADDEAFVLGTTVEVEADAEDSDGWCGGGSRRRREQQSGWWHSGPLDPRGAGWGEISPPGLPVCAAARSYQLSIPDTS
jgi:hypothetical protein